MSWEVYLYIGITSLYLYNTPGKCILQDGIIHKILPYFSCKGEKSQFLSKKVLTETGKI